MAWEKAHVGQQCASNSWSIITQFLRPSINDEASGSTSEDKGSESSVMRQSPNKIPSIILFLEDEIKAATNDLSDSSKIGYFEFLHVYKGNIHDTEVTIQMQNTDLSNQVMEIEEFHHEMEVLGRMRHPNIVNLIGACLKPRALVYEVLPYESVEDYLKKNSRFLTWQIRTRIVYEICSALTFLHTRHPQPVVLGDLKPANIFLDANFTSKLAIFRLCSFLPRGTATVETDWYIDLDFLETGNLTSSCDVYSFGITMLRILTGAPAARVDRKVKRAIISKSLMAIIDSTAGEWPENVAEYLAHMGLECCDPERKRSKLMKNILSGLKEILAKIDI